NRRDPEDTVRMDRRSVTGQEGPALHLMQGTRQSCSATAPLRVPLDVKDTEPARPRPPDRTGTVVRSGVRIPYAVYGAAHRPTVMLLPTWTIVPSRIWRFQVAALARHLQVVTFEGRGSAEGDSPAGATAYRGSEVAADTVAVMDDAGVDRAVLVGFSLGAPWAVRVAAEHPDRVDGLVLIAGSGTGARQAGHRTPEGEREAREMEAAFNATAWVEGGWEDFVQFFFSKLFSEPHSTKPIEDAVRWARRVDPAVMVDTLRGAALDGPEVLERESRRLTQPVLVLHGTEDKIQPASGGELLADWTGGALTLLQGSGHAPHVRDPVRVSRMIEDFTMSSTPLAAQQVTARQLDRASPADVAGPVTGHSARRTWTRAHSRPRRALYLSSPIGLGHARRDVAVAQELRNHHPDLQIDW